MCARILVSFAKITQTSRGVFNSLLVGSVELQDFQASDQQKNQRGQLGSRERSRGGCGIELSWRFGCLLARFDNLGLGIGILALLGHDGNEVSGVKQQSDNS